MEKLSKPYRGGNLDFSSMIAYRDSRHAFNGQRLRVEKPSYDWAWAVAGLAIAIVSVLAFAARMS